jgi:hypothetical protein
MDALQLLAERISKGDAAATTVMRRELETQLVHIVRRTVRLRTARTAIARQILAEAGPTLDEHSRSSEEEREQLVARVARRVCDSVIARLRCNPAANLRMRDTVCA